jgi:predicted RNase H-like nuclease (RuvC/YqgF family)
MLVFGMLSWMWQNCELVPDAIGYIGDEKYLIEFAKSSYIGERKLKKIKKSNLFCIEVDIIKTKTTIEAIENHLLNERDYKHIVHIPEYREMTELKEKFKDEWYKLKNKHRTEIEKLRDEINDLQQKIVNISAKANEYNDVHLYYKKDCKNGAKMYVSKHSRGNVVAFEKNKIISCYFK